QTILSIPGGPCMMCMGFLTEHKLAREASLYGTAGGRPQVVWSNGVLASTAVGVFTALLTGWSVDAAPVAYLTYDGNGNIVQMHPRAEYVPDSCIHYPLALAGDPVFG